MKKDRLIYIMDPHCIRSYANEKAIKKLRYLLKDKFIFEVLPGGMWEKKVAPRGGQAMREFLQSNLDNSDNLLKSDISSYYHDLVQDSTYLMASDWPSQAIVAVKEIYEDKVLDFAYALMKQQFSSGKRYDIESTYLDTLSSLNLDHKEFDKIWKSKEMNQKTMDSFRRAKNISKGLPSLVLEYNKGFKVIRTGIFRPEEVEIELNAFLESSFEKTRVA